MLLKSTRKREKKERKRKEKQGQPLVLHITQLGKGSGKGKVCRNWAEFDERASLEQNFEKNEANIRKKNEDVEGGGRQTSIDARLEIATSTGSGSKIESR